MDFKMDQLKDNAMDLAIGTGAAIASLHVIRRTPKPYEKYSGWVLLSAGIIGLMVGGKVVKTASLVAASVGAINAINSLAAQNGQPAADGWRGAINKVVPQLNGTDGVPMLGFGSVEDFNEGLLCAGDSVDQDHLIAVYFKALPGLLVVDSTTCASVKYSFPDWPFAACGF